MTEELRSTLLYALAMTITQENDKDTLKVLLGAELALLENATI